MRIIINKKTRCIEHEYIKTINNQSDNVCLQRHKINI